MRGGHGALCARLAYIAKPTGVAAFDRQAVAEALCIPAVALAAGKSRRGTISGGSLSSRSVPSVLR
jgi:hypothetical protein